MTALLKSAVVSDFEFSVIVYGHNESAYRDGESNSPNDEYATHAASLSVVLSFKFAQ